MKQLGIRKQKDSKALLPKKSPYARKQRESKNESESESESESKREQKNHYALTASPQY